MRVFIVSSTTAIRAGIKSLLMEDPRIHITGEAASLEGIEEWQAEMDVVVWSPAPLMEREMLMTELDGLQLVAGAGLLIIHDDPTMIEKLARVKINAWGLLPHETSQEELITAVAAIYEGLAVTRSLWLRQLPAFQAQGNVDQSSMPEALTGREIEILQLLAMGLTNKQAAARLGISAHTVKFHVSSIFGKMGTTNRTETVKLGLKKGLISL